MAGRGAGGLSLTKEQITALGISKEDNSKPKKIPQTLYPPLERKPLPLTCDAATEYMLVVKEQLIECLHNSPAYVKMKSRTDDVERYSDKYKLAMNATQDKVLNCIWNNLPPELRPQANHIKLKTRKKKLDEPIEIEKRLKVLEEKESQEESKENDETNGQEKTVKIDDEEEMEEEQDISEDDEDETDYANNYFDNGEDYDDNEDDLDDEPVY